jgi:hypothetical protein
VNGGHTAHNTKEHVVSDLNTRLMCVRAQAELLKHRVAQAAVGGSKGGVVTPAIVDPRKFRPDFPEELRPYVPEDLFTTSGKGKADVRRFWQTDRDGYVNLYKSLTDNLDEVSAAAGGSKGRVANNALEASDNMIDSIAKATKSFTSGDFEGTVRHAGRAVGDMAQVWGHGSAGNW